MMLQVCVPLLQLQVVMPGIPTYPVLLLPSALPQTMHETKEKSLNRVPETFETSFYREENLRFLQK